MDIDTWANESFNLSKSNVYTGVTENQALSQSYIQQNQDVIKRQIVLGGLRLAHVMIYLFANGEIPNEETSSAFLF